MSQTSTEALVREAHADEYEAVGGLTLEAYEEFARALDPAAWQQLRGSLEQVAARAEKGQLLVAEEKGEMVAAVHYYPPSESDPRYFPPEWASLRVLAVSPAHRGRGFGRLLTEECIRRARANKASHLGLHTSELMTVARGMYERMGFRQERELPGNYGLRYWLYVLELTQ